jgi:hypothetical protein
MYIEFAPCFPEATIRQLAPLILPTFEVLSKMAPWRKWVTYIECMDDRTIIKGRRGGAGHGQFSPDEDRVWVNPYMSFQGVWLNIIHEQLHGAYPDASEMELNNLLVPYVARQVLGYKIDLDEARLHGLGPAVKGIPGRGYAGT